MKFENTQYSLFDMEMPLVSIITPVHNGSPFINDAYISLKNQSYTNWEWLITDDFSKDNSLEILKALASTDSRIKVLEHSKNQGAAVARNRCIDLSQGEFIAFLDIDDRWLPEKLAVSVAFLKNNACNFTYTNYKKLKDNVVGSQVIRTPSKLSYNDLLKTCPICTSTVVIKKRIIGDTRMEPQLRRGQDYLFWLHVLSNDNTALRSSEEALTLYSVGHCSLSSNKIKKAKMQWMIYRKYLHLNLLHSGLNFFNYAFYGLSKYLKF